MNYYLIELNTMNDSTTSQAIWKKDDLNIAIMDFHSSIASAMANENVVHLTRIIIDEAGNVFRSETWDRPVIDAPENE